jgi:hypothetical protein
MGNVFAMPMQWSEFQDIDEVEPMNADDAECLAEVRDVLKKHEMLSRFGIALLHKHFDLKDDEILLETSDNDARTLILKPTKKSDAGDNNVGTIFALREGSIETMSHCHTFCKRGIMGNHFGSHRKIK